MLRRNIVAKAVFQGRTSNDTTANAGVNAVTPWGKLYPIQRQRQKRQTDIITCTARMAAAMCVLLQTTFAVGEEEKAQKMLSPALAWCANPGASQQAQANAKRTQTFNRSSFNYSEPINDSEVQTVTGRVYGTLTAVNILQQVRLL